MFTQVSKTLNLDLYPDLQQSGGLASALQRVLQELGTELIAKDLEEPRFIVYAFVGMGDRSSQVTVAAHERAFHVDFWNQGVQYGSGWIGNLKEVGEAITAFQVHVTSVKDMVLRFPWWADTGGSAHERGPEYFVAQKWQSLEEGIREEIELSHPLLRELLGMVVEAARHPELRRLLPFRSLFSLCFSRTTGYPYTRDCPVACPIAQETFRVMLMDGKTILGHGHAAQAANILVANLPPNCGAAVHGAAPWRTTNP